MFDLNEHAVDQWLEYRAESCSERPADQFRRLRFAALLGCAYGCFDTRGGCTHRNQHSDTWVCRLCTTCLVSEGGGADGGYKQLNCQICGVLTHISWSRHTPMISRPGLVRPGLVYCRRLRTVEDSESAVLIRRASHLTRSAIKREVLTPSLQDGVPDGVGLPGSLVLAPFGMDGPPRTIRRPEDIQLDDMIGDRCTYVVLHSGRWLTRLCRSCYQGTGDRFVRCRRQGRGRSLEYGCGSEDPVSGHRGFNCA